VNEQSSISSAASVALTRESHRTLSSCVRSLRYVDCSSSPKPGWQASSVAPDGSAVIKMSIKASTLMARGGTVPHQSARKSRRCSESSDRGGVREPRAVGAARNLTQPLIRYAHRPVCPRQQQRRGLLHAAICHHSLEVGGVFGRRQWRTGRSQCRFLHRLYEKTLWPRRLKPSRYCRTTQVAPPW
jgi:hypothetical protein